MTEKDIENISYNVTIPECLKTDEFEITAFLELKENITIHPLNINFNNFKNFGSFILNIQLKNINDFLNCLLFFNTFSKRTSNLINFDNWDDEKEFDFIENYKTKFHFSISDIKKFCNTYNIINFNPHDFDKEIKKIFKMEFLNI